MFIHWFLFGDYFCYLINLAIKDPRDSPLKVNFLLQVRFPKTFFIYIKKHVLQKKKKVSAQQDKHILFNLPINCIFILFSSFTEILWCLFSFIITDDDRTIESVWFWF